MRQVHIPNQSRVLADGAARQTSLSKPVKVRFFRGGSMGFLAGMVILSTLLAFSRWLIFIQNKLNLWLELQPAPTSKKPKPPKTNTVNREISRQINLRNSKSYDSEIFANRSPEMAHLQAFTNPSVESLNM
jgi:hypothetical protein